MEQRMGERALVREGGSEGSPSFSLGCSREQVVCSSRSLVNVCSTFLPLVPCVCVCVCATVKRVVCVFMCV